MEQIQQIWNDFVTWLINLWDTHLSLYWYWYIIGLLVLVMLVLLMLSLSVKHEYVVYAKFEDGSHGVVSYPMSKDRAKQRKEDLASSLYGDHNDRNYSIRRYRSRRKNKY